MIVYDALNDLNTISYPTGKYPDKITVFLPDRTVEAYKSEEIIYPGAVTYKDEHGNAYRYRDHVLESAQMVGLIKNKLPGALDDDTEWIGEEEVLRIASDFLTEMYGKVAAEGEFSVIKGGMGYNIFSLRYAGPWHIWDKVWVTLTPEGVIRSWYVEPRIEIDEAELKKAANVTYDQIKRYCLENVDPNCVLDDDIMNCGLCLNADGVLCFDVGYVVNHLYNAVMIPVDDLAN